MSVPMIDPHDIQKEVEERVKALCRRVQGRVYTGNVPDGDAIPVSPAGYVLPYIVLINGGTIRTENRTYRSIAGARQALKYHTFMVICVGATDNQVGEIAKEVRDVLEGYEPVGGGEISEETSGNAPYPADTTLKPTRYERMLGFSLLINT